MQKFRKKENKRIAYYELSVKELGRKKSYVESFYHSSTFNRNGVNASKLGEFAIFTADLLKNVNKAEEYFLQSIEKEPDNSFWIGNYAIFLHYYKKDIENADKLYQKSLEMYEDDAFLKHNYAVMLLFYKKDYNKVEKLLKSAIELEPENSKYLCTYAAFLFKIRKKFDLAENFCKKALEQDESNAEIYAIFAQLMILKSNLETADQYISKALELDPIDDLKLELWFYRYAHYNKWLEIAEQEINLYLSKKINSYAWGLQQNVVISIFSGHPFPQKVEYFANKIMGLQNL
jgi:tetratricopeptide (TPR) repeat protein